MPKHNAKNKTPTDGRHDGVAGRRATDRQVDLSEHHFMTREELISSLKELGLENQTRAAKELGVSRVHMNRLVKGHSQATGPLVLLIEEKLERIQAAPRGDIVVAELRDIGQSLRALNPEKRVQAVKTIKAFVKTMTS